MPPALGDTTRYLRHAIDQANLVYAVRPTHRDLDERPDADWRLPWPLGRRLDVVAAREEQATLAQAAPKWPVLFTIRSADELELHAGSRQWRLACREQDRYELTRSATGGGSDSRSVLTRWLAIPPAGPRRGVRATVIEWADGAT